MKEIGTIVAVICVCSVASSLVDLVAPKGSTQKLLHTVLGVFILCGMIVPIKNLVLNFDTNVNIPIETESITEYADDAYNQAVVLETKINLQTSLSSYLQSKNIKVDDVNIELEFYDDGGIYIENISIYISKEYSEKTQLITSCIKEKFEVEPKVVLV